jgi:Ca2+-transporting ATPase
MTHIYNGLTALQVAENRNYFGANTLSHASLERNLTEGWTKFIALWFVRGLLIAVMAMLFIIPLLDFFTEDVPYELWIAFIACVLLLTSVAIIVLLVAAIRLSIQRRKEKRDELLNNVRDRSLVKVVRDGKTIQVPRMDIVVGDIIVLEIGDEVPADAVLLESSELVVSEYILNGNIECEKVCQRMEGDWGEVFESNNYVMCGSIVLQGKAVAQVFAVGNHVTKSFDAELEIH